MKVQLIKLRKYMTFNNLTDDVEVLETFYQYSGSSVIENIIIEIAEMNVPIYTDHLWKNAQNISEYILSGIQEGLCESENMEGILATGYFLYYDNLIYHNLEILCFNYIANLLNFEIVEKGYVNINCQEVADVIDDMIYNSIVCSSDFNDLYTCYKQCWEMIEDGVFDVE